MISNATQSSLLLRRTEGPSAPPGEGCPRLAYLRFPAGRFVAWHHSRQSYRHPRSRIGAAVIVGRDAYRCCRQAALRSRLAQAKVDLTGRKIEIKCEKFR